MSHAGQGHQRWRGHNEEFWQSKNHWRWEWQTSPVFFLWQFHEQFAKVKDMTLKGKLPSLEGVQYATGEEQIDLRKKTDKE